jgi:hypothetical protein
LIPAWKAGRVVSKPFNAARFASPATASSLIGMDWIDLKDAGGGRHEAANAERNALSVQKAFHHWIEDFEAFDLRHMPTVRNNFDS